MAGVTDRELRLRQRIDTLTDRLERARRTTPQPQRPYRWCVYCGNPSKGRTCRAHADLEQGA